METNSKQIQQLKRQPVEKSSTLDRLLDLLFKPSFAISFAVGCAFVFCCTLFFSNTIPQNSTAIASAQQLSNSEIQAYIAENNDEFDERIIDERLGWGIDNKSILENSTLNEEELNAYYNSELNNEKI
jgi:hypothetical protein